MPFRFPRSRKDQVHGHEGLLRAKRILSGRRRGDELSEDGGLGGGEAALDEDAVVALFLRLYVADGVELISFEKMPPASPCALICVAPSSPLRICGAL